MNTQASPTCTVDMTNRETVEWAHFWWNGAKDDSKPRVLIIGDSIVNGSADVVYRELADVAIVDKLTTSKNVKDPALLKEVRYMLSEYKYAVIHFNHGLHGLRITEDEYEPLLRSYVTEFIKLTGNAKLIWGSITPLRGSIKRPENSFLKRRNEMARHVMEDFRIPVDDLWQLIWNHENAGTIRAGNLNDHYHYNEAGATLIGKAMANAIRQTLLS